MLTQTHMRMQVTRMNTPNSIAPADTRQHFEWSKLIGLLLLTLGVVSEYAHAASSEGCVGGGFVVLNRIAPADTTISAGSVDKSFQVRGKYVQFDVDADTFGVRNWTLTGAFNPLDITGGTPTPVFASKLPDHRGLVLTSGVAVELKDEAIELQRTGPGLSMKIQSKDCAQGGVFQMEVERGDGTTTLFTHVLADSLSNDNLTAFYFDNRNFRNRERDVLPYKDTTVTVSPRVNFGNDFSPRFVGRDSPQVATRRQEPGCVNQIATRFSTFDTVQHCGSISRWDVASGGRMGQVMGEDAVEVAPPATTCVENCQAQNQVRGQAVVLGFPFPVRVADRLKPRFSLIPQ